MTSVQAPQTSSKTNAARRTKDAASQRNRLGAEVGVGAGTDRAADKEMEKEVAREMGVGADKDKARVMERGREMGPVWLDCRI